MIAARIRIGSLASEFWNAAAVPWNAGLDACGHADFLLGLVDGVHGVAQRGVGRKVEREGDDRELSLMIDDERRGARLELR